MRILLVEDNIILSALIKTQMSRSYVIDHAVDLAKARFFLDTKTYDLLILDIILPDGNGCDLCKYLKDNKIFLTTIFLTAEATARRKLFYLQNGNGYLIKPFNMLEFEAKIKVLLHKSHKIKALTIKKDNLEINQSSRQIYLNKKEIKLNRKEFSLLLLFLKNRHQVLSKTIIAEQIWQDEKVIFGNTIEATIYGLRRKLGRNLIETIKGVGYSIRSL